MAFGARTANEHQCSAACRYARQSTTLARSLVESFAVSHHLGHLDRHETGSLGRPAYLRAIRSRTVQPVQSIGPNAIQTSLVETDQYDLLGQPSELLPGNSPERPAVSGVSTRRDSLSVPYERIQRSSPLRQYSDRRAQNQVNNEPNLEQ